MIYPAWLSRPMVDSRTIDGTFGSRSRSSIALVHSNALLDGRKMRNCRVSICHPKTDFDSSGVPSPTSLRILVASSRGSGSLMSVGRNVAWTARGAAFHPFCTQQPASSMAVIISSI